MKRRAGEREKELKVPSRAAPRHGGGGHGPAAAPGQGLGAVAVGRAGGRGPGLWGLRLRAPGASQPRVGAGSPGQVSGAGLQGEPPLTAARSRAAPAVLGAAANQILLRSVVSLQG